MADQLQFRSVIRRILPPWFSKAFGYAERLWYVFGLILDQLMEWAHEGAAARLPGQGTDTALPYIGRDRRIRRGFAETVVSFAARLVRWRDDWKLAGGTAAVLSQLRGFLTPHAPVARYVHRTDGTIASYLTHNADGTFTYTIADPANWNWDGQLTQWSRFWIVLYPPPALWTDDGTWGNDADWGDGGTWGTSATTEEVETVRALCAEWKSAGSKCVEIIIAFSSGDFEPSDASPPNPDGNWQYFSKNVAGVQVPARLPNAAYWPGP